MLVDASTAIISLSFTLQIKSFPFCEENEGVHCTLVVSFRWLYNMGEWLCDMFIWWMQQVSNCNLFKRLMVRTAVCAISNTLECTFPFMKRFGQHTWESVNTKSKHTSHMWHICDIYVTYKWHICDTYVTYMSLTPATASVSNMSFKREEFFHIEHRV